MSVNRKRILGLEMRKCLRNPALWLFIMLCLLLNIMVTVNNYCDMNYINYVGNTLKVTGTTVNEDFLERAHLLPKSHMRSMICHDAESTTNVFEEYKWKDVSKYLKSLLNLSGFWAEKMDSKYKKVQRISDEKSKKQDALSFYAGNNTYDLHDFITNTLFKNILLESCIIGVIIILYTMGCENLYNTEQQIYSTKTGRNMIWIKITCGVLLSILVYVILCMFTFGVFAMKFHLGQIWNTNVSSCFNYLYMADLGRIPFFTWTSLTVGQYLMASIVGGVFIILVFDLFASSMCLIIRNMYRSFLMVSIISFLLYVMPFVFAEQSMQTLYFMSTMTCIVILRMIPIWFTDMVGVAVIPYHECVGIIINLLIVIILFLYCKKRFNRKEI